jgi:hypothetical protein
MCTSPNFGHVPLGYHAPGYNPQIRGAVKSRPSLTEVLLRLDISLSINHNFHYLKKKPHSTFVT